MRTFDERRKSVEAHMGKIKRAHRRNAVVVTSICLAVSILAVVLFVPYSTTPPDVSMYAGSDYYNLIQRLNEATYQKPRYKNNFEALVDNLDFGLRKGGLTMAGPMPMAPGDAPNYELNEGSSNGNYEEVTDNQVDGVIEPDLMKRSDQYIFYFLGLRLQVYSIAAEESELVGEFTLPANCKSEDGTLDFSGAELFLSEDCKTLTLVSEGFWYPNGSKYQHYFTGLINIDVSDPTNITIKNEWYFVGRYVAARMVNGCILLVCNTTIGKNEIDFENPSTYVPQYGVPEDMKCISGENIVCPQSVDNLQYTVISKLDAQNLKMEDCLALLSYSQELYVSEDTIYATHSYTEINQEKFDNNFQQKTMTEITGISYSGEGLEILGTIALEGNVKNQYSMDQYEGVLRVVTSTTVRYFKETFYGEFASTTTSAVDRNVNLYCIDLSNWEIAAEVIAFAPDGEDAQSVRFDGYNAYVCTAEVITIKDPVYFFDLSDMDNITWKDTGTIDGYSTSLIQMGDGYLLGIGFGEERTLKIEVYKETESGVISVCSYVQDTLFSSEYKSYYIDRKRKLIGVPIYNRFYTEDRHSMVDIKYILLSFDGSRLNVIKEIDCITMSDHFSASRVRSDLIGEHLYLLCYNKIIVERLER